MNNQPIFDSPPLERVREGMAVIDADGRQLGSVRHVQMGDPQAVASAGDAPTTSAVPGALVAPAAATEAGPGVLGVPWFGDAEGLADAPDVLRSHLRRAGFIQVEGTILEGANRFIPGDRIAEVSGDVVRLHPVSTEAAAPVPVHRTGSTSVVEAPAGRAGNWPVERSVATTVHDAPARQAFMPRALTAGGATALVLGSAGLAAWVYRRRQQEQARPINRVRRTTAQLRESFADNPPVRGGALGSAMLLVLLAVARRARRDRPRAEGIDSVTANSAAWRAAPRVREMLPSLDDLANWQQQVESRSSKYGVGRIGAGLLLLSGGGLLFWWRSRGTRAGGRRQPGDYAFERQSTQQVPITREEITIERRPVERHIADRPIGGEQDTLENPLRADQTHLENLPVSGDEPRAGGA